MNRDIIIREARTADLNDIFDIERNSFESSWTRDNLEQEMALNCSIVLLAISGREIIGFITAWLVRGEIQINRLAVLEKYRRRGVARMLLDFLVIRSAHDNPFKILLEVRGKNTAARAFYRSMGFIESGVRKGYYRDDNAVLLEKELSK